MKKAISVLLGLCLVLLALVFTFVWQPEEEPLLLDSQKDKAPVVSVLPAKTTTETVEIVAAGVVQARSVSNVNSRSAGYVEHVSETLAVGNRVKKGSTLLTLNTMEYHLALANARQELADAKVKLLTEIANAQQAEYDIIASANETKTTELARRIPQLREAEANFEAKKIALEKAEEDLAHSTVRAPFDGVILSTDINKAEWLGVDKEIFSIADISALEIVLPLSADQWALMDQEKPITGTPVKIHIASYFNQALEGVIKRINPEIDNKTGSLAVIVEFENIGAANAETIPLGAFAQVIIPGKTFNNALWLPQSSLLPGGEIWGVSGDKLLVKLPVTVLQHKKDQVLVQYDDQQFKLSSIVAKSSTGLVEGQSLQPSYENINKKDLSVNSKEAYMDDCDLAGLDI